MESQPQNPEFRNNPENFYPYIFDCISDNPTHPNEKITNALVVVTFFLHKDSENVVCCAFSQWLPA